jgi:hypothetical protein
MNGRVAKRDPKRKAKRQKRRLKKELLSAQIWAKNTYAKADLPDARLNKRLVQSGATLAGKPHDSIPQASADTAEAKAMYRLIENKRVTMDHFLTPAAKATARRCAGEPVVLAVQDTTGMTFAKANTIEDLGPIASEPCTTRGIYLHSTIALREDGMALGLFDLYTWARKSKDDKDEANEEHEPNESEVKVESESEKKKQTIEDKESWKWIAGIRAAHAAIDELPEDHRPRLSHIGDREKDVYEVLVEIDQLGDSGVIRCNQNRRVELPDETITHAYEALRSQPVLCRKTIEVPRKKGQPKRKATVEIRRCPVRVHPPHDRPKDSPTVDVNLVEVWEPNPPEGVERLHWRLWTFEPVETIAEVERVVQFYCFRWRVEDYHQVLKSGCRIEEVQFETLPRILKILALYAPIALRILQLRDWARREPHAPCTVVLSKLEWKTLWTAIHNKPPPARQKPPSLRQAALWIGRLGGHLNRKGDGMPGVQTLWQGWRDLILMTRVYSALADP